MKVRKAVITAAGRRQRGIPLQTIIDRDGVEKSVLRALLDEVLTTLPKTAHLTVLIAGNVGAASAFPWFLKPVYTSLTLRYHEQFRGVVTAHGGTYVDLFTPPKDDLFVRYPEKYLARDGFHPSSLGYALWFTKVKQTLNLP